jgi:hypothetical protein
LGGKISVNCALRSDRPNQPTKPLRASVSSDRSAQRDWRTSARGDIWDRDLDGPVDGS